MEMERWRWTQARDEDDDCDGDDDTYSSPSWNEVTLVEHKYEVLMWRILLQMCLNKT